jgi:hypothetical protein
MGLRYENLDDETRRLMVEEIEGDTAAQDFYPSTNLTPEGLRRWPELLLRAALSGTDDSLARSLTGCFKPFTMRQGKKGPVRVTMRVDAPEMLSEGQFNAYYMRALARRALAAGTRLVVFRAKSVAVPRSGSEQLIGTALDPAFVLQALRETKGVNPPTGVPLPNTGITVRLAP